MDLLEKLQKRSEINRKIGELLDKIHKLQRIRSEIERVKQQIDRERETWTAEYGTYKSSSLAEDIMIVDHFEGAAAEQMAESFPDIVEKLDEDEGKALKVSVAVGTVLIAIDMQITLLNAKIAELRSELAALA